MSSDASFQDIDEVGRTSNTVIVRTQYIHVQTEISGENAEMYLFQFLSSLEKTIADVTPVRTRNACLVL
jgi:hypothetical protein